MTSPERPSVAWAGWLVLLFTWLFQLAFPQLAYPEYGLVQLTLLIGLLAIFATRISQALQLRRAQADEKNPGLIWFHHGAQMGIILLIYAFLRWAVAGFPAAGVENLVSLFLVGGYVAATYMLLLYSNFANEDKKDPERIIAWQVMTFCGVLAGAMVLAGIHAFVQYFYLYEVQLEKLKAEWSGRPLTTIEEGLLHHFSVRRVASVFGDPNSLGGFAAMSLAAAIQLMRMRWRTAWGWLGVAAAMMALGTIVLTGSRGAVLDVLLVILLYGWAYARRGRRNGNGAKAAVAVTALIVAFTAISTPQSLVAQDQSGLMKSLRLDTVVERINYWHVGKGMISERPWLGHGPGSVEYAFGKLKPETARETRFLHNWILQIWAEYGWFGFAFTAGFFGILFYNTRRAKALQLDSVFFGPAVICMVFCFDALIQHSVYQRELMATFGIAAGTLLFAGAYATRPTTAGQIRRLVIGVAALVLVLLLLGLSSLYARGKKQIASDLIYSGRPEMAMKYVDQADRATFMDSHVTLLRAKLAEYAGETLKSISLLSTAIEQEPRSAALRIERAQQYKKLGQNDLAWKDLRGALERYPSNPDNLNLAALWSLEAGEQTSATVYARGAVRAGRGLSGETEYRATLAQAETATTGTQK